MEQALDVLQLIQPFVYGGVAVVALVHWRRYGGRSAAWLAASFALLAIVVVTGVFLPENSDRAAVEWAQKVEIAVLVLFPFSLYRFTATFALPARWMEWVAAALTGAAIVAIFPFRHLPDEGEPQGRWWLAYIAVLLVQWVFLSVVVAVRLWRAGHDQPNVARRRMQMLSVASLLLAGALVVAGAATGSGDNTIGVIVSSIALLSAGLFLLGFAPPGLVRLTWRRPEEARLREAELRLMEAMTPDEVARIILPQVVRLTSGSGAALLDARGRTIAAHGDLSGGPTLTVPMRAGELVVTASPYTPYFGREENELVQALAALADLALARAELLEQERRTREQLSEAQRLAQIGSWDWEIGPDLYAWSKELYSVLGVSPDVAPGRGAYVERTHPDDRVRVEAASNRALEERGEFTVEHRIILEAGEERTILLRGQVLTDARSEPVRMIGTSQDITEQKREEHAREQFIANAAHELRTPLAAVLGLIEVLSNRRDELTTERVEDAFEALARSGNRIGTLVNSLLDLTRLQQSRSGVDLHAIPVRVALEEAVAAVPPPEGFSVQIEAEKGVRAMADPERLDHVLSNLLTNAYKYGRGRVQLGAAVHDSSVVISIADDGPGVDPAFVGDLFEPFSRSRHSAASTAGSGLGLAIALRAAEACGGSIWYERREPGGARFCVRLAAA